jgi:hypothetical protein
MKFEQKNACTGEQVTGGKVDAATHVLMSTGFFWKLSSSAIVAGRTEA